LNVFIYEFVTGGGFLEQDTAPPTSLLCEGRAMVTALVADFASMPATQVTVLQDRRVDLPLDAATIHTVNTPADERAAFVRYAAEADATIVIAPEFDGLLQQRAQWASDCGGRLLSPDVEFIALAADKQQLADRLKAAGVPVTSGVPLSKGSSLPCDFEYPAVLKPRFGAGSESITYLKNARQAAATGTVGFAARLERFVPGTAVSVIVLCGRDFACPLPACLQRLSTDGRFTYAGGSLPINDELACRARNIAMAVVEALKPTVGAIGVDIVLGERADDDAVVEVNPRMTTSYVGLRAACAQNLASAMLHVAEGREAQLTFADRAIAFDADGRVRVLTQP
jgi:hypothetical protein